MSKMQQAKAAVTKDTPDVDKLPYRVSVDLVDQPDLVFPFASDADANAFVDGIFAAGYVIRDHSADASRKLSTVYPIYQIKAIVIYEAAD
jgi:hypothetical protein